eukprot:TRINITY_DN12989_c0_g1_i5.p1 TRINITY_DN12989_c0_g1~~TRINITY_DN12989_c0_g1_i5.p1  ORF type:complete len:319 (+),score=39.94 TRINITY_DN12989_c0_g1_i5:110-958(+)
MMASLVVRRYGLRPLTTPLPVSYHLRSFSTKPDSSKALTSSGSLLARALAETKKAGAEFSQGTKQFYYNLKHVYGTLVPALKRGEHLSRGDLILVRKTKSDVMRLIPFSLYFCIPLSAVLLPFVMRILPQIIPSTFWTASNRDMEGHRGCRCDVYECLGQNVLAMVLLHMINSTGPVNLPAHRISFLEIRAGVGILLCCTQQVIDLVLDLHHVHHRDPSIRHIKLLYHSCVVGLASACGVEGGLVEDEGVLFLYHSLADNFGSKFLEVGIFPEKTHSFACHV